MAERRESPSFHGCVENNAPDSSCEACLNFISAESPLGRLPGQPHAYGYREGLSLDSIATFRPFGTSTVRLTALLGTFRPELLESGDPRVTPVSTSWNGRIYPIGQKHSRPLFLD
jgi:hypothetical protein